MTWMEMKSNPSEVRNAVESAFCDIYQVESKTPRFIFSNGDEAFSIIAMGVTEPWNFLVVEYQKCGEDGDAFYPEDYDSIESLIFEMRKEIDDNGKG